tara:strand:- start:147 stop:2639 length:2493 start_codon:yes stop_codon:yes gene_type:complete
MSTIKISELATSAISLTDFFAKADASGLASKNNIQSLSNFLNTAGTLAFRGVLLAADAAVTEDGIYVAGDAGTYTNNGGLVITVSNQIVLISITGAQTVFEKVEIPITLTIDATPTEGSVNAVESGGVFDGLSGKQVSDILFSRPDRIQVYQNSTTATIKITGSIEFFDGLGGFYIINAVDFEVANNKRVYLSSTQNSYTPLDLSSKGTGAELFLRAESITFTGYKNNAIQVGGVWEGKWINSLPSFKIYDNLNQYNINDVHFTNTDKVFIQKYFDVVEINITEQIRVVDGLGGYRVIEPTVLRVGENEVVYLSAVNGAYSQPNLLIRGTGEELFLYDENYYSKSSYRERAYTLGVYFEKNWSSSIPAFNKIVGADNTDYERFDNLKKMGLMPNEGFSQSKIIDKMPNFTSDYRLRNSDVTIVQVGDSISTNLEYSTPLIDAPYNPPLITEDNINSRFERKLRWREQKYRRFDSFTEKGGAVDVFTEILGGGTTSEISEEDATWGFTAGNNNFRALTRCITGGNQAGVSFNFPANMRRCNFILHSDFEFGASTVVTTSESNGVIEASLDGITWVEANGFSTSFQESSAVISNATYGDYHKDVYQKRLHFRSLTDLTEKTITIKNTGTGRFGYWGIEYSPRKYMFTYICASKGGHKIEQLELFQEWMVESFNPKLIIQQCCIINQGVSTTGGRTPTGVSNKFDAYYDQFITLGYEVVPYILFLGSAADMVNTTTGAWQTFFSTTNEEISVTDFIGHIAEMYRGKNAPFINCFYQYLEISEKKARLEQTDNIWTSALEGSGIYGDTLTTDGQHLNNYGTEVGWRLLKEYFNF